VTVHFDGLDPKVIAQIQAAARVTAENAPPMSAATEIKVARAFGLAMTESEPLAA